MKNITEEYEDDKDIFEKKGSYQIGLEWGRYEEAMNIKEEIEKMVEKK